ncbi:uncharacterized protein BN710_00346 [Ruminococcus sp. CAG:563]|nr:uncharacterized protein BN710_00346 [Ruminococcus sp. CAG:563]DAI48671.1 MAG TPA: hypothetical protein [Caudoviricetes sp.]HJI46560.1 hypothetical protein [Oscillospiraceae bacterium]
MSCWEVKDYLGELTDISAYKEEEILPLCRSCIKEIESKLKPDADRKDFRVVAAAAGLAYYKLALKKSSMESEAGITSFKAGDVSIEQESKTVEDFLDRAKDFYEKKAADIIPLCKDDSFAFNQIKVM